MNIAKEAKTYVLATQGIFNMIVMGGLGYLIGYLINKDSALPIILAVIGILVGLTTFVSYLLYLIKQDEKEKKKNDQRSKD